MLGIRANRGFTLLELLVVITVIGLLIGVLVPVLAAARESAVGTSCLSNQRQLLIGVFSYAVDHRGQIPYGPEEGQVVPPPIGPVAGISSGGRDFYVIDGMITSEISTLNGEYLGAGLMLQDYMQGAEEAFFCPGSDQPVEVDAELAKIGTASVISGYLYRHAGNTFDEARAFNADNTSFSMAEHTQLDNLGLNREGNSIRALFVDNNFKTASGSYYSFLDRTNHELKFSNIAFADGHAEQRDNTNEHYVADISGTSLVNGLDRILRVFDRADRPE